MATTFNLSSSFDFTDPNSVSPSVTPERGLQGDGIAYNGTDLFVIRTDAPTGQASRTQTVLQFNTNGNYVGEFDFAAIGTVVVGGTTLPNGNLLVATLNPVAGVFTTRLTEVKPDGTLPGTGEGLNGGDGLNISLPGDFNERFDPDLSPNGRGLVVGATYDPNTSTIFVVTSRSQEVVGFNLTGTEVSAIGLSSYGVTAPQGLAIHPVTGNLFVADESEAAGGSNKIYEFTAAGDLISIIDTKAQFGWDDPEGLAFSADGSTLYVVFDGDDADTVGNRVAVFTLADIPSAFTVTTTTDENDGDAGTGLSLRDAILAAAASASAESTIFLPSGTYTLTLDGIGEDAGATGDLDIVAGKTITIVGASSGSTIIDASGFSAGNGDRVFHVLGGATLNISGVTVTGASLPATYGTFDPLGGGFLVDGGQLNASDVVITGNTSTNGGGIFVQNGGLATVTDSTISNNTTTFDAGGVSALFGGQFVGTNLDITGNTAARNGGGIGVAFGGSVTLENSTITENTAQGAIAFGTYGVGGGIHVNDGSATISNTTVSNNSSVTAGGGIAMGGSDPSGQGNPAPVSATITNVTLTGNTSGSGNGIALLSINTTTPTADPVGTVDNFVVNTATVGEQDGEIAFLTLSTVPNLSSIDKYGDAGVAVNFALTDFTEKLVDVDVFPGPAYTDADGDALASLTIISLPENGTLTLSGGVVSIGDQIAASDIANLFYTSNVGFAGVDSFQITASDGTYDSAPANVDVFVNSPAGIKPTLLRFFDFDSADGLTFNPTTRTIFASDSYRVDPNDPNTVVWALREIDATTGAEIRAVSESEDDLLGAAVPNNVDIDSSTTAEGVQGMAVVQGTGTDRDGNILLLSTRASKVIEIDYETGEQVTAANGGFEFTNSFIFSATSSVTGIYHAIVNGEEVLWAADFRGRRIVQFAKDGTLNDAATIDLLDEIPDAELQGIVIDSDTGNFLLVDDATGNASNIYEVTPDGQLISTTNLLELTGDDRFADTEGLGINPLTGELYVAIDDDLRNPLFNIDGIGDRIAVLQLPIPTLSSIDKYGDAGSAISFALTDFTEKLVDVDVFPGPAFIDDDGDALASLTIISLPENGTLTLSGGVVSIGDQIAASDIANLIYTSNVGFAGVDSFQITASDGTSNSAPANVDVFVNSPAGIKPTLLRFFDFNSADGLTFNPTTRTIFASDAYRVDPNDPNTVVWALREIDAITGAEIRAVSESEDDLLGAAVPNVDIDSSTTAEGIQGMAVVQGTGTDRDGNILLLSTRAAKVIEIDYETGEQVTAANGGFEFTNSFIFSPSSSVTGIYHAIVNGEEVLWAVDFRGRRIVQFAKDGTLNDAATIDLFDEIPDAELQGIVIDPATGNFLLVDDATGNASNIYEVTPDGQLISTTNLLELTGDDRFADTEGLGINPLTGELYVAIDDDLRNPLFNIDGIGDRIAVLQLPTFGKTQVPGIFSISSLDIRNLVINATNNLNVNIGIFFVDDALGSIGDFKPGDSGYLQAAAGRAISLLAALLSTDNPQAPGQLKKVLGLKNASSLVSAQQSTNFFFGFLSVEDVSIGDLFAISNGLTGGLSFSDLNISLSTNEGSEVEEDNEGGFNITLGGFTFNVTFDADEIEDSFGGLLGIDLDGDDANDEIVDEVIAKCDDAGQYTISGTIFREAAYNNTIGFFLVNADGAVLDTGGNTVATPDDLTNYKSAIVANLISAAQYQVSNNTTIDFSFSITTVTAAVYVLPVLAVQGDFSSFSDIYYPIIAANTDKFDHMKFQGARANGNGRFFGFEDLASSVSDNDFDDFIVQVNVAAVV